jgi:hypothetical protein
VLARLPRRVRGEAAVVRHQAGVPDVVDVRARHPGGRRIGDGVLADGAYVLPIILGRRTGVVFFQRRRRLRRRRLLLRCNGSNNAFTSL